MAKMTKEDWVVATTCVGSTIVLNPGTSGMVPTHGMQLAALSQRLSNEQWNAAADMSEGMLKRTDDQTPD